MSHGMKALLPNAALALLIVAAALQDPAVPADDIAAGIAGQIAEALVGEQQRVVARRLAERQCDRRAFEIVAQCLG